MIQLLASKIESSLLVSFLRINVYRNYFLGLAEDEELKNIDKEVRKEVDEATNVATTEGCLPPEALYSDIFANTEPQVVRGCTADETVVQPYTTTAEILTKMGRKPKVYQ